METTKSKIANLTFNIQKSEVIKTVLSQIEIDGNTSTRALAKRIESIINRNNMVEQESTISKEVLKSNIIAAAFDIAKSVDRNGGISLESLKSDMEKRILDLNTQGVDKPRLDKPAQKTTPTLDTNDFKYMISYNDASEEDKGIALDSEVSKNERSRILLQKGYTIAAICKMVGLSRQRVRNVIKSLKK